MVGKRRIELAVESLPADPGARIGRVGTQHYYPLSHLAAPPQAFLLQLRDSAGLIKWEPDGVEGPATGRVFAALLKQLYDGNCWRMNLAVDFVPTPDSVRRRAAQGEDWERDWLFEYMSLHKLSHAFQMLDADPDFPDDELSMDYWWCPKRALSAVLADTWSQRSMGYVAPWPDRGALKACFGPEEPVRMLESLLSTCRLVFQGRCEGEEMVILSRQLTRNEVDDAVGRPTVQDALRKLNEKALLIEWVPRREMISGIVYTVYEKPRPGGSGRQRVYWATVDGGADEQASG